MGEIVHGGVFRVASAFAFQKVPIKYAADRWRNSSQLHRKPSDSYELARRILFRYRENTSSSAIEQSRAAAPNEVRETAPDHKVSTPGSVNAKRQQWERALNA
jgi:hypothetical protein